MSLTDRIRAGRPALSATSGAPREHVVVVEGAGQPHVVREPIVSSPFTRRASKGELPVKEVSY